jgi:hypothetical protein
MFVYQNICLTEPNLKGGNISMQYKYFEWDDNKNEINIRKHGVSFQEASTVFNDDDALYDDDDEHSYDEKRFTIIGRSDDTRLLFVCHCYRENGEVIRLISARKADKLETDLYYGGIYEAIY